MLEGQHLWRDVASQSRSIALDVENVARIQCMVRNGLDGWAVNVRMKQSYDSELEREGVYVEK